MPKGMTTKKRSYRPFRWLEDDALPQEVSMVLTLGNSFNSPNYLIGRAAEDYPLGYRLTDMGTGNLPESWAVKFLYDHVDYVVYSGETPIAWRRVQGPWVVPSVAFSEKNMESHKDLIQTAIGLVLTTNNEEN